MSTATSTSKTASRRSLRLGTALMAVVALVPSCLGFGNKLLELFQLAAAGGEGSFALVPLCNYILATIGFTFLLGWAACNGMFHDIEKPKIDFLERERRLDALWGTGTPGETATNG